MGSASDRPVMDAAAETLRDFGVEHEVKIYSAHRTPAALEAWVSQLRERGFAAVIAAAGVPPIWPESWPHSPRSP